MANFKRLFLALFLAVVLSFPIAMSSTDIAFAETNTTTISDEHVPLGAAEDLCTIHWIVLIASVCVCIYTASRVAYISKQVNAESTKQSLVS